jgi:GNAT superfamily N-acetyltransferase
MQELVDLDYDSNMALVACLETGDVVAMARYDVDPATRYAEIAFVVRDDWQRRGIGTLLLRRMIEIARARGLRGLAATVLTSNHAMLRIFQRSGLPVESRLDQDVVYLQLALTDAPGPAASAAPT